MTMYDYFAAAALQGMLAAETVRASALQYKQDELAERAYEYAEAMVVQHHNQMSEVFQSLVMERINEKSGANK